MIKELSVFDSFNFPTDWKREKFRWVLENRKKLTTEELPLLGANLVLGVTERFEGDGRPAASEDLSKYKVVDPGDIIMNPLGKPHGSIGRSNVRGITSPAYWVLRCDETNYDSRYVHYLLRSEMMINEFQRCSKNLPPNQFDLPWDQFRAFELAFPPIEEQRRIADYLDVQSKLTDEILALRRRQVSLLIEEQSEVLRGLVFSLNANVRPLKHFVSKIGSGKTPRGGADVYADTGVLFLRSQNVYNDGLRLEDVVCITSAMDSEMAQTRVFPGDLLLNITGGSIGRCARVPQDFPGGNVNQHVCIVRPFDPHLAPILHSQLISPEVQAAIREVQVDGNREGLNFVQVSNLPLRIPEDPQSWHEIGENLTNSTSKVEALRRLLSDQDASLRELKSSLISAAVTGEFDVATGRSVA